MGKLLQTSDKHLFELESELKRSSEESHLSYFITAEPSYKFDKKIHVDQFGLNAEVAGLLRNALSSTDDSDQDLHIKEVVIWVIVLGGQSSTTN